MSADVPNPTPPASNGRTLPTTPGMLADGFTLRGLIGPAEELAGDRIGPYTLLKQIGEGGFGIVWLAERREPVVQRVAIKILKPGMDSRQVLGRFEQERQALAVMNHPCVARIFDAGATPAGRPYFVMEHVAGETITAFCDRHRLSVQDRLSLFLRVCDAVQHAHTKGIIHRDIKPSNVLVSVPDGQAENLVERAVPKVIDFGVAKATMPGVASRTVFTELGVIVGTPEYMSPEQAESGALDIDTRTDVYALGVLLYELLTGALPFDPRSLRSAGYAEIQRIIREVDPPRPSTRLSGLGAEHAARSAEQRRSRPGELERQLRRELEWIPLKAMRKNRDERYRTPEQLADDIRNYLDHRPLVAGPESSVYRLRKFVRKHRGPLWAAGLVGAALLAGAIVSSVAFVREAEARRQTAAALQVARAERDSAQSVNDFLNDDLLGAADAEDGSGKGVDTRVIDVLESAASSMDRRFADRPDVLARVARTLGGAYIAVGKPLQAEEMLRRAASLTPKGDEDLAIALAIDLSEALFRQGRPEQAIDLLTPRIEQALASHGPRDRRTIALRHMLGACLKHAGRLDEAESIFRDVLSARETDFADQTREIFTTRRNLSLIPMARGTALLSTDRGAARPHLEEALRRFESIIQDGSRRLGAEHFEVLAARSEVPKLLFWLDRAEEASTEFQVVVPLLMRHLGPTHWRTLDCRAVQASMLRSAKQFDRASEALSRLLDDYRFVRGAAFGDTLTVTIWLADALEQSGRADEARQILLRAFEETKPAEHEAWHRRLACVIAALLERTGDPAQAAKYRTVCGN